MTSNEAEQFRRDADKRAQERGQGEEMGRLVSPEKVDRARTAQELLDFTHDWETERGRDLDRKYGDGFFSKAHAWLAGEWDIQRVKNAGIDKETKMSQWDVKGRFWEAARRAGRTLVNRTTIVGGLGLLGLGVVTGGVGALAYAPVLGAVAGRGVAESWAFLSGKERKAREQILLEERQNWADFQQLRERAVDGSLGAEQRQEAFSKLLDTYYGASNEALKKQQEKLGKALEEGKALRDKLERLGFWGSGAAALGVGFFGTGAEAGSVFGKIDLDWDGVYHSVFKENGIWNYAYNAAEGSGSHPLGSVASRMWEWKIGSSSALQVYGHSLGQALLATGIPRFLATKVFPAKGESKEYGDRLKEQKDQFEIDRNRVAESFGAVSPVGGESEPGSVAAGTGFGVEGLNLAHVMDAGGIDHPWDPEWRYVQVTKVETDPNLNKEIITVTFSKNEQEARTGGGNSFQISRFEFGEISRMAIERIPVQPVPREAKEELATPKMVEFVGQAQGAEVKIGDKLASEKLQILVDRRGFPLAGQLKAGSYRIESIDQQQNRAKLLNEQTKDVHYVDLLKLHPLIASEIAARPKPVEKSDEVSSGEKTAPPAEKTEAKKDNPAKVWNEAILELNRRGESKPPIPGDVWVVGKQVDDGALIGFGADKGKAQDLPADRYRVTLVEKERGAVILESMTNPALRGIEVGISTFVDHLQSKATYVRDLLHTKYSTDPNLSRILSQVGYEVRQGQTYDYEYPGDAAPLTYKVQSIKGANVELVEDLPVTGPQGPKPKRHTVDALELAEHGTFVGM